MNEVNCVSDNMKACPLPQGLKLMLAVSLLWPNRIDIEELVCAVTIIFYSKHVEFPRDRTHTNYIETRHSRRSRYTCFTYARSIHRECGDYPCTLT